MGIFKNVLKNNNGNKKTMEQGFQYSEEKLFETRKYVKLLFYFEDRIKIF